MTTEASRPQPSPGAPRSDQPAARKRSPVERVIVWGLILVLVAVVGLEARARLGYDRTLEALEARNLLTRLSTLEDAIHFAPARQPKTIRHQSVLELKWFSLLHDYRIGLIIDSVESDDPLVMTFHTAGEENGLLALEGKPEAENEPLAGGGGGPPPMHEAYAGGAPSGPAEDGAPPAGDTDDGAGADPDADPDAAAAGDAPLLSQP